MTATAGGDVLGCSRNGYGGFVTRCRWRVRTLTSRKLTILAALRRGTSPLGAGREGLPPIYGRSACPAQGLLRSPTVRDGARPVRRAPEFSGGAIPPRSDARSGGGHSERTDPECSAPPATRWAELDPPAHQLARSRVSRCSSWVANMTMRHLRPMSHEIGRSRRFAASTRLKNHFPGCAHVRATYKRRQRCWPQSRRFFYHPAGVR